MGGLEKEFGSDGKSERTIQTLEIILPAYVLDLEGFSLMEFAYNIIFYCSIGIAPFKALYMRKYNSFIHWDKIGEKKLLKLELVYITTDKLS